MPKISVDEIVNPLPDRNVSPHLVDVLVESISDVGLLNPLSVTPGAGGRYELVAGRQRLAALKRLGTTHVEATVIDDFDAAELATIVENVVRQDLTALELAEALERWQRIYEKLHPDAVAGSRQRMVLVRRGVGGLAPAFAEDVAEKTDWSSRTLRRLLHIAEFIDPEIRDLLRHTPVADIVTDLEKLANLPADEKRRIAEMLHSGEAMRVAEASQKLRDAAPNPNSIATDPTPAAEDAPQLGNADATAVAHPSAARTDGVLRIPPVVRAARSAVAHIGVDPSTSAIRIQSAEKSPSDFVVSAVVDPDNPDLGRAMAAAVPQIAEITVAKRAWYGVGSPAEPPADLPAPLPLDQVAGLAVMPLVAEWLTPDLAVITRAGVPVAYVPVERVPVSEIVKKSGNRKTDGEFVIANSFTHGHFRMLTGFEKSDQPSPSDGFAGGGLHANHSGRARQNQDVAQHYDVISNGVINDDVKIRLPNNGGDLGRLLGTREDGRPQIVRVDVESSDGSLSLSLGIVQSWAEANPDAYLTAISRNYFRPSDAMLRWAAALPNLWVGATVSGWFSEAESEARWAGIERLMAFDVPTVIWITTYPDWDNESIVRRAKKLVGSDRIIEAPYFDGDHAQRLPLLGTNRLGACGDQRYDGKNRQAIVVAGGPGDVPEYAVENEDGTLGKPYGTVRPQCRGCSLKCGFNPIFGAAENAEDADDEQQAAA